MQGKNQTCKVRCKIFLSSVFYLLYSMPIRNNKCFGVWPKHNP